MLHSSKSGAWRFTIASTFCEKYCRRYSSVAALGGMPEGEPPRSMSLIGKSQGYSISVLSSDEGTGFTTFRISKICLAWWFVYNSGRAGKTMQTFCPAFPHPPVGYRDG